jgi:hypothetical protein
MVSESTEFVIGSSVSCSDGPCAELARLVVGRAARTVTHLVVGPPHRGGPSRLVPVRLAAVGTGFGAGTAPQRIKSDRIPAGKVEVRRGEPVHATDGPVGKVRGLAVLTRGRRVTHVLLDEGHLWGKRRVAIPIGAVADFSDGVRLSLTRDEVRDLPRTTSLPARTD